MTKRQDQEAKSWPEPPVEPRNVPADKLEAWRAATAQVRELALRDNLVQAEVARRIDMPAATFSLWYSGLYTGNVGNQTARVNLWLSAYEESRSLEAQIRRAPSWIPTPTAEEVIQTLRLAQTMPEMVFVCLGAGMGKTSTLRQYAATRPGVTLITMRPATATVTGVMQELALALDVVERDTVRRDRAIGERMRRNGRQTLLAVDEAQNLKDVAIDQLRHFFDIYEVGIALVGNNELYRRFGEPGKVKDGYGQLHRRFGARIHRLKPRAADLDALIAAWGVEDDEIASVLRVIGSKLGSLGQISKTMQLAGIMAAGEGRPIDVGLVKRAWANRSGEETH